MVSIIICHRNLEFLNELKSNIEMTVGVGYELIVIDNSANSYSIFEAYNLGVEKSVYQLLCFMHEDLKIHTKDWGELILKHFEDVSIGMLGVIGGNVFPKSPSPWWAPAVLNDHLVNNIQHWTGVVSNQPYHQLMTSQFGEVITRDYHNPYNKNVQDAAVLDGLFFVIRKELFASGAIRFDETNFSGFHCYDSDISLQVGQHRRVVVVYDLLIEHFQQGTIDKSWYDSVLILARKWHDRLPVIRKEITSDLLPIFETEVLKTFVYWMIGSGFFTKKEIADVISYFIRDIGVRQENRNKIKELKCIQWVGPKWARIHHLLPNFLFN